MANIYARRVDRLRALMADNGWDAVIITGSDPHSSEYPALRWKQVEWISGFTGEAGDIVITADHAGLWTDTRYFIQANQQLEGTGIVLHKTRVPEQVLIPEWIATEAFADTDRSIVIAVDGLCQRVSDIADLASELQGAGRVEDRYGELDEGGYKIISIPDMLDSLWEDRPAIPQTPVTVVDKETTGESRSERLEWLRGWMISKGHDSILITALDEIAWLLNVRGSDIDYNPLVISYLLVTSDSASWFVRKEGDYDSISEASFDQLAADGIKVLPYDDAASTLADLMADGALSSLSIDPSSLNYDLYNILKSNEIDSGITEGTSPVILRKAIKTEREIEGMKRAHLLDGIAMEKFLYWLEAAVQDSEDGGKCITEWDASVHLGQLRAQLDGFQGESFETISAYGESAALPHYITPQKNAPVIEPHGLYLCDSGGQFLFGTTDITRTVPMGPCTALEREDYTLVLKGHIDLAMAVFPAGTPGCRIDALARNPLWQHKRNFGHGTGHGVGFYLGVHEGPHDVRQNLNSVPLQPGMIMSDEPGIYREGKFGIRHENLLLCVADGRNDFGEWLRFENLTYCHIDTSAVVTELMTRDEIDWLNAYNESVYRTIAPHLPREMAEWLSEKCQAI